MSERVSEKKCWHTWNGVPHHEFPSHKIGSKCVCGKEEITQERLDEWERAIDRAARIISCAN